MPAITGIIGAMPPQERAEKAALMLGSMNQEPFYVTGNYVNDELEIAVGWNDLDANVARRNPIWNRERDRCLIFCGRDNRSSGEIDLISGFETEGNAFLEKINGWFCGVLVDLQRREVLLFNDRYGVSRIFFHEAADALYFSTEPKSLLAVLPKTRSIDPRGLGEMLSCGSVLQDRTLFSGIQSLPGAAAWTFSPGSKIRRTQYFNPIEWEEQSTLNDENFYYELKSTWRKILPNYLRESGPMGLSLTGGVDSRMILAWANREKGALPCYTFCGNYRESNDVVLARKLAKIAGQPHHTFPITNDFFKDFGNLAEKTIQLSDGAMDVSGALDLYMQQKAREVSPVRLSGVYGGEILRRLVAFKPMGILSGLWSPEVIHSISEADETYRAERADTHPVTFTAFKQAPWHMTSKFAVERSQIDFVTPFFDNDLVRLAYRASAGASSNNQAALRLIEEGNPAMNRIATDRGLRRKSLGGLTKLQHAYRQFLFKAEYAYDYGMPQKFVRADHVVAPLRLERLFLGRYQTSHFRVWYRDQLSHWVKELLLDDTSLARSYLQRTKVESILKSHLGGVGNYTLEIHRLLSLELIQRQLLSHSAQVASSRRCHEIVE